MTSPVDERGVYELALDEATVEAGRAAAEVRRMVRGGTPWTSPTLGLVLDRFGRAKRAQAIARALLDALGSEP